MWQIIKNEWVSLFRNRILLLVSIGFLGLLALTVLLGIQQTNNQSERQQHAKEHLRAQWDSLEAMNPHRAAHYGTYVFKPTGLLNGLDEGVNSITGNVLRVEGHVQNEIVHSEASQSQAVSKFGKLKSALLLQYIVPLLLIFLAFQSINSEKQSGRIKLLLLQGMSPSKLLFGKVFSVWFYSIGLLSCTVIVYTLINLNVLSSDIVFRTLLLFLSYSLYYFILSALTVSLTARWKNGNLALTFMLATWILWTIFIPNILMSTVESWHELPSRSDFKSAMKEDRSKGLDGHNPEDERSKALEVRVLEEYGVDSLSQLPINFDGIVMQEDEEYGNKVWDKHFGALRTVLAKQKANYQLGGIINPFISLQNASMGFAGNDNFHHQDFLVQVENYRRVFIKSLNDEHAFGGSTTGDWSWNAEQKFFQSIEDFDYQPVKFSIVVSNYFRDLGCLILWVLLVSLLLIFGTGKMEIL